MTLAPCQMPVPAFDRPLLLPCSRDDEDEDGDEEDNHLYQPLQLYRVFQKEWQK